MHLGGKDHAQRYPLCCVLDLAAAHKELFWDRQKGRLIEGYQWAVLTLQGNDLPYEQRCFRFIGSCLDECDISEHSCSEVLQGLSQEKIKNKKQNVNWYIWMSMKESIAKANNFPWFGNVWSWSPGPCHWEVKLGREIDWAPNLTCAKVHWARTFHA